ncbi:MAG: NAD(+)/NADH kinase [Chloroflexota bacterium]
MDFVGIIHHPQKPESQLLAAEILAWLEARDVDAWTCPNSHDQVIATHLAESSLLIVLGGDGSTLQAARLAAPFGVPIFGINMGRVGFLSEATPDVWQERLARVLRGDFWLERRLMLQAEVQREDGVAASLTALNDVVVSRSSQMRVLQMKLYVDSDYVTTYTADGLIVATPTGSTAYSLAAGGPLLLPELGNFMVLPVAPHLSLDRALVLHPEAIVCVEINRPQEALLAADGQETTDLQEDDLVTIRKSQHECLFTRLGKSNYFYHRLIARLGMGALPERD